MPHYDYRCTACGHEFELFQSMTAPVQRKCPACGKPKLERLIGTGAGVIFKGGGFYETDYRSEAYRKAAEAEAKAPPEGSAKKDAAPAAAGAPSTSAAPATPPAETKPAKSEAKPSEPKRRRPSKRRNGAG